MKGCNFASLREVYYAYHHDAAFAHLRETSKFVPGDGNWRADIVFVGEAPGRAEDAAQRPFVGPSGEVLNACLMAAGLARSHVFITNVVKYRPPANRDPEPEEIQASKPYLRQEIDIVDPKVVVTLGRHALNVWDDRLRIGQCHGQRLMSSRGRIVVPLYHPAYVLRNPKLSSAFVDDFTVAIQAALEATH